MIKQREVTPLKAVAVLNMIFRQDQNMPSCLRVDVGEGAHRLVLVLQGVTVLNYLAKLADLKHPFATFFVLKTNFFVEFIL